MNKKIVVSLSVLSLLLSAAAPSFAVTTDEEGRTCTDPRDFPPRGFPGCDWPIPLPGGRAVYIRSVGSASAGDVSKAVESRQWSSIGALTKPRALSEDEGRAVAERFALRSAQALDAFANGTLAPGEPPSNGGGEAVVTMGYDVQHVGNLTIIEVASEYGGGTIYIVGPDGHGVWIHYGHNGEPDSSGRF